MTTIGVGLQHLEDVFEAHSADDQGCECKGGRVADLPFTGTHAANRRCDACIMTRRLLNQYIATRHAGTPPDQQQAGSQRATIFGGSDATRARLIRTGARTFQIKMGIRR